MLPTDLTEIGKRISALRELSGLTQDELSAMLNVRREKLAKWETGIQDFKTQDIINLSIALSVSTDYLLGRTDKKSLDPIFRSVCEYTCLSENAVQYLNYNLTHDKLHKNDLSNVLSELLSNGNFYIFLRDVFAYSHAFRGMEAIQYLLGFFMRVSREGLFEQIPNNEREEIIDTIKEYVTYYSSATRTLPDQGSMSDSDYYASIFNAMKESYIENTDLYEYRSFKRFQSLLPVWKDSISLQGIISSFEKSLRESNISDNTIDKIMNWLSEDMKSEEGD